MPLPTTSEVHKLNPLNLLTDEEHDSLFANARSINGLLKWAPDNSFVRTEGGLTCKACSSTLMYDFSNEKESFTAENMTAAFRQLKYDMKRHIKSITHEKLSLAMKEREEEESKLKKHGKQIAINCASVAYMTYKLDASYSSYENIITEFYNSGASVGQKNHSKEFPRLFLPHVYTSLAKAISSFIMNEGVPIGIVADKMTVNHRTRHIIGLRVPIFDINNDKLFENIYLEHHFCNDVSGRSLSKSIIDTLKKFGLNLSYIREQLVGLAVDGQYIQLWE